MVFTHRTLLNPGLFRDVPLSPVDDTVFENAYESVLLVKWDRPGRSDLGLLWNGDGGLQR